MNKKTNRIIIIILILITLIALAITAWALFFRDGDNGGVVLSPDYAPIEEESNAEEISGDQEESKLTSPEGGGAVSLIYQKTADINLSEKEASLLFGNPKKSNQNIIVQLVIKDEVLVQSGLITPGNRVTKLSLLDGKESILKAGGYDGKLVVLYYDPISGEKAVLNTEIPVTVTVSE